jgi:glycosyltransferase involved in cell wall biosynthesis
MIPAASSICNNKLSSTLKILLAHNYYRSSAPSGEDTVFRAERALLERAGHEVILFERYNDDIDESSLRRRIALALDGAWSRQSYDAIAALIRRHRPDIAHFHNTFPQISPSAYAACRDNGVPVVQTLHNYRLICANALLLRDGKPCEACVGASLLPALRYRCYRGSLPATGAIVWMLARNRWNGAYRRLVNRYIALTQFAAGRLIAGGLPSARMSVKPNFLDIAPAKAVERENLAIYVGRLSEEKGVRTLVKAWQSVHSLPLKILGDGPLRAELSHIVKQQGLKIELLGQRPKDEVLQLVRQAAFQIVPSECYEGFPMVILEAYACGTPVVASDIGSLAEIVEHERTGLLFRPGDAEDLARKVEAMATSASRLEHGRTAQAVFEQKYTAERNLSMLMDIYRQAREDQTRQCAQ